MRPTNVVSSGGTASFAGADDAGGEFCSRPDVLAVLAADGRIQQLKIKLDRKEKLGECSIARLDRGGIPNTGE